MDFSGIHLIDFFPLTLSVAIGGLENSFIFPCTVIWVFHPPSFSLSTKPFAFESQSKTVSDSSNNVCGTADRT
ncbi:MAG: hypothetical protein DRP02_14855 [Candidatus Gerdarchaeota archaeon]|nr:MAG: hypothetical protein DRP02_14855 [Candidatus Gerdarchaeota archaeon]